MADTAGRLVDERLPEARYRQWVFSFPWRLRVALARDGALLSEVLRACVRKVFVHQRRVARKAGIGAAKSLAVAFVQRFGSLLQLNPHAHVVVPDAVWFDAEGQRLEQHEIAEPSDAEVEAVGLAVVRAVLRIVGRAEARREWAEEDEQAATAALVEAASAVGAGRRPPVEADRGGRTKRRTAVIRTEWGTFSIHANTTVEASDRAGLERLLRYAGRPALSQQRLSRTERGQVRYRLRKPYYTGQTEVVLEPEAFVRRLAALVPPSRQNQVRYYGLLAAQARDRERLLAQVPGAAEPSGSTAESAGTSAELEASRACATVGYRTRWARLLSRVFGHEVLRCPACGGERRIIAALTEREVVVKVLAHLGLPTEVPEAAPARAPPQLEWSDDAWPVA